VCVQKGQEAASRNDAPIPLFPFTSVVLSL
jgi:hypothetical protein